MKKIITILVLALFVLSLIPAVIAEKGKGRDGLKLEDNDKNDNKMKDEGKFDKSKDDKDKYKEEGKFDKFKDEYKDKIEDLKEVKEELKQKKEEIKELKEKIKKDEATDTEKAEYVDYVVKVADTALDRIELLVEKFGSNELLLKKLQITKENIMEAKEKIENTITDGTVDKADVESVRMAIKEMKGSLGLIKSDVNEKLHEAKLQKLNGVREKVRATIDSLERAVADVEAKGGDATAIKSKITEIRNLMSQIEQLASSTDLNKEEFSNKMSLLLGELKEAMHAVVGEFKSDYAKDLKKRLMEIKGRSGECAQENSNICKGVAEGSSVKSCDTCNTCTCVKGTDNVIRPSCTEMACPTTNVAAAPAA